MAGNHVREPNKALISVSIAVFDELASWKLNAHSTKVSSRMNWLDYFRSFSKAPKLSFPVFAPRNGKLDLHNNLQV